MQAEEEKQQRRSIIVFSKEEYRKQQVARVQAWRRADPRWRINERRNKWNRLKGWNYYAGAQRESIMMTDASLEINKLREQLHVWNHEYYVWAAPSVSDAVYDTAFNRLKELEAQHQELYDYNSPTARVGSPEISAFQKVNHAVKMLSLEKAQTVKDVVKFFPEGAVGIMEPKIDGVSLSLTYHKGKLAQAVTRGDGSTGDDVTLNARTIRNIPLVLTQTADVEVRGEVYMTFTDFDARNAELAAAGEDPLANPRNAAAGALKLMDSAETAKRRLSFIAYSIVTEMPEVTTQEEILEALESWGFSTTSALPAPIADSVSMSQVGVALTDAEALRALVASMDESRKVQNFPTDGLVFKISDLALQRELSAGTTSPKWAVAYKFAPDQAVTTVLGITVTVGKTGKLTPVAELRPVALCGTVVARASLSNSNEIGRLGINVGDEVAVVKAQEIIPNVVSVVKKHSVGTFKMPDKCPCCGSPVTKFEGLVDSYCVNVDCLDQVRARLVFATGKSALDIDGAGPAMIEELVAQGVRKLSDLFALQDAKLRPAALHQFKEGREKAKQAPFWRKLQALCVEGHGKSACQELAVKWPTMGLLAADSQQEEILKLLGKSKYASLMAWMEQNLDEISALYTFKFFSNDLPADDSAKNEKVAGKFFVITGTLAAPRDQVEKLIEAAGGALKGTVSAKVDYLVIGGDAGATKIKAATKHGTACIAEEALWEMLGVKPVVVPARDPDYEF